MQWSDVRKTYPNEWLIIEALDAETTQEHKRKLKRISIVERCFDGGAALQSYRRLHQQYPLRELYYVHSSREELDIREQIWIGIRGIYATHA